MKFVKNIAIWLALAAAALIGWYGREVLGWSTTWVWDVYVFTIPLVVYAALDTRIDKLVFRLGGTSDSENVPGGVLGDLEARIKRQEWQIKSLNMRVADMQDRLDELLPKDSEPIDA